MSEGSSRLSRLAKGGDESTVEVVDENGCPAEPPRRVILFFGFTSVFSNFYPSSFIMGGLAWFTVEQCYQYMKAQQFNDEKIMAAIRGTRDPRLAKQLGRKVLLFLFLSFMR